MKAVIGLSQLGLGLMATATVIGSPLLIAPAAQAQQVVNVAPTGNNAPNNSTIAWQFDNVNQVEPQSIRVFLNNQDVTGRSILDPARNYFGYRPPSDLSPGNYEVRVEFKNKQGQGFVARWPFQVANSRLEISSVTHNAADKPLGRNASFLATINGTPGAQASVLLVQNGKTVRTLPATQVSSGVYVASVTVGPNDNVSEGIVVGRLQQGDRVVYSVAPQAFAFNPNVTTSQVTQSPTDGGSGAQPNGGTGAQPTALNLAVNSHQNNGTVDGGFTLTGTATPGATVVVNVTASAPALGPFSLGSGQAVVEDRSVVVGEDGKFSVPVPRATIIQKGTTYTVNLTAKQGTATKEMTLKLRQR